MGCTDGGDDDVLSTLTSCSHDSYMFAGVLFEGWIFLVFYHENFAPSDEHIFGSVLDAPQGARARMAGHLVVRTAIGITDVSVIAMLGIMPPVACRRLAKRREGQSYCQRNSEQQHHEFLHINTLLILVGFTSPIIESLVQARRS